MEYFGPQSLFVFCAVVYSIFILIILYRMGARPAVPDSRRGRFIAMLRTSPVFAKLARRTGADDKTER